MTNDATREIHPAALLFPLMPAGELQKLADDIKTNGLLEPIVTFHDQILDGRNRLKACEMARVEPRYTEAALNGNSPTTYVGSKNLHRRHLTPSQLAAIAAEMMPLLREEAQKRQQEGGRNGGRNHKLPPNSAEAFNSKKMQGECREVAAKTLQVGKTQVQQAVRVKERDPDEFERVKRGETAIHTAYQKVVIAQRKKPTAKPGTAYQERRSKAAKKRMIDVMGCIHGGCRGLAQHLDIPLLLMILNAQERKDFRRMAFESARHLRKFGQKLGGAQ